MVKQLWTLLEPFHRDYGKYLSGVIVRQSLLVLGGYSMVWVLRACQRHAAIPEWYFVGALILYDAGFLRLDIGLNTMFAERLGYPLFGRLRTAALSKVLEMPLEWHHRQDSGELVGKVNNGVGKAVQTAESASRELAPALIRTGLSVTPLLFFSPVTTPFLLGALGIFLWLTVVENRKRQPFREARYGNYAKDFGVFSECVQYVQPVVQFGQTGRMLHAYGRIQREIIQQGIEETRIGNVYAWRRNMLLSVTKRTCQGVWLWQFRDNTLDAAMVMYLSMLTEDLLSSFWGYAALLDRLHDGAEPVRILVRLLEEQPEIRENSSASPVAVSGRVAVDLIDVGFSYARGNEVLRDFNLSIQPGRILGVVGRSGCGKTTIHNLLSRMFDPQRGRIEAGGRDIRLWPLDQLRGLYSHVAQSGGVFLSDATILDTIRFARPDATIHECIEAAKTACIHADIMRLPQEYETKIGSRGATMSKGQQQRVALAQALIALDEHRKVLILDEFTSALDSRTEEEVLRNLTPYLEGRTVIIIAHRLSTLKKIADRIVVLGDGGIVEQGSHEELVERGGFYADLARQQAVA